MFLKLFKLLFAVIFILDQFTYAISVAGSYNRDSNGHDSKNLERYERQTTEGCQVPDNPPHTKFEVIGYNATNIESGSYVPNYVALTQTCDEGYNVNPTASIHSLCINNAWIPPPSDCKRTCPSLTSITSTNVKCKWNDIPLENCSNPVEGTTAILSCNPLYEDDSLQKNPIRLCKSGKWDPTILQCHLACGLKRPRRVLNILDGRASLQRDYPWQAGIYNTEKKLLCEGTIITQKIILSAAHCFTDADGNVLPTENFLVASGKYYSEYSDARDTAAQYSNVHKIQVPARYKGNANFYEFDISVIILTDPFKWTGHIQPICIQLNEEFENLDIVLNSSGVVTGWNGMEPVKELRNNEIQYIPHEKCYSDVPSTLNKYVTFDKICARHINNGGPFFECANNDGAGVFFYDSRNGRHFLKAIASGHPEAQQSTCDSNEYMFHTSIAQHIVFIRDAVIINHISESLES